MSHAVPSLTELLRAASWCAFVVLAGWCSSVFGEELRTTADRVVDVQHIRLDLDVSLKDEKIAGSATLSFRPLQALRQLTLNAVRHDVSGVHAISGEGERELKFHNTGEEIVIDFPEELARGSEHKVRVSYSVQHPGSGLYYFRPSELEPEVPWMVWSHGEPWGNRHWFPSYDHPVERQSTEMVVTVDAPFDALSNGKLVSKESVDGNRTRFHWLQEKDHVSYLVTLVVGEFKIVQEQWRGRPVTYYVPPKWERDIQPTFQHTTKMLDYFSERFGVEYPWDKYAQVVVEQFIIGGMENTSATSLYDNVMHDERSLQDSSPDWLIAHELAHQWWGDLVTCKDWAHLWLNEGFATYAEVLWMEHHLGQDDADYELLRKSRLAREGLALTRPIVDRHYEHPSDMFDSRVYPKGGWVLHMLRRQLGDDDFFQGLQRYALANAYQTAETSDLRKSLTEQTGLALERFFYDWTERPGHPRVTVNSSYLPEDKLVKVEVKQTQDGDAFHFPLVIELGWKDQKPLRVEQPITEKSSIFYLPAAERPHMVRIDPELSLLAELKEDKSRDWWEAQLTSGSVVDRIRAVEHFKTSKSAADVKLLLKALNDDKFYGVRVDAAKALGEAGGDAARDGLIAALQAEHAKVRAAVASSLGKFDADAKAQQALRGVIESKETSETTIADAIRALSKISGEDQVDLLLKQLDRDSRREVVRQAAVVGLSQYRDARAIDAVLQWAAPGRNWNVRLAAIEQLGEWMTRHDATPEQQERVIASLVKSLQTGNARVRRTAASTLGVLGAQAQAALNPLEASATQDADQRVADAAKAAATKIREATPPGQALRRINTDVENLKQKQRELEGRLKKFEATAEQKE